MRNEYATPPPAPRQDRTADHAPARPARAHTGANGARNARRRLAFFDQPPETPQDQSIIRGDNPPPLKRKRRRKSLFGGKNRGITLNPTCRFKGNFQNRFDDDDQGPQPPLLGA